MNRTIVLKLLTLIICLGAYSFARADVFNMPVGQKNLEFVTVGDVGNAPDSRSTYGRVNYQFNIGKYDVTSAQYAQFLNAIAKTDTKSLYDPAMSGNELGCGIIQSGTDSNYSYSVVLGKENYPVNYVTLADSQRFVNWLVNGQPSGLQTETTTETGTYNLLNVEYSSPNRTSMSFFIPNNDEWYKAAYYKGGGLNAGYWRYPTRSDTAPSNVLSPLGTNNANVDHSGPTPVGFFENSPGPYGTFDQGGNVLNRLDDSYTRSGSYRTGANNLSYATIGSASPTSAFSQIGFRIAAIPEPSSIAFLICGAGVLGWKLRRNTVG